MQPENKTGTLAGGRKAAETEIDGIPVIFGTDSMFDFARREIVDEVVLSMPDVSGEKLRENVGACQCEDVN